MEEEQLKQDEQKEQNNTDKMAEVLAEIKRLNEELTTMKTENLKLAKERDEANKIVFNRPIEIVESKKKRTYDTMLEDIE